MTTYGLPYRGSKNSIAEWVVGNLPQADVLVDLFAGGCAVTHCALASGKWRTVVANDWTDTPSLFADAVNGAFADYCAVPTREEFEELKDSDRAIALLYSFGNNCESYLWGRDIEDAMVHASRMLLEPQIERRKKEFVLFMRSLPSVFEAGRYQKFDRAPDNVCRIQRMRDMQWTRNADRLVVSRADYRDVDVPSGAVVYCDPPYRGAANPNDKRGYGGESFDFAAFDEWLFAQDAVCVVSDYECIDGCTVIAEHDKKVTMSANSNSLVCTEVLMVPTRKEPEYRQMMAAFGQQSMF